MFQPIKQPHDRSLDVRLSPEMLFDAIGEQCDALCQGPINLSPRNVKGGLGQSLCVDGFKLDRWITAKMWRQAWHDSCTKSQRRQAEIIPRGSTSRNGISKPMH